MKRRAPPARSGLANHDAAMPSEPLLLPVAAAAEVLAAHPYGKRGQVLRKGFRKTVDVKIIVADAVHFGETKQNITCFLPRQYNKKPPV